MQSILFPPIKGRGIPLNPQNRFERLKVEVDPDWLEAGGDRQVKTEYFVDQSKEILARNDSPDVPFTYSINPYRGCEHGCVYCYARPTHEYFGLSAGLDFETKIMVKTDAPRLLEKKFTSRKWKPQPICLSGNTDCYQPAEKQLQLTRKCLQVFLKFRNPVSIITKNALILRDLDLLMELARFNLVRVTLSVTTLDNHLARTMEPRTSAPPKRLEAIERLASEGIPTGVNVAPVIPGLTDHEMPEILRLAASHGATSATYILLRLPYSIKEVFTTWLRQHYPDRAERVIHAIQDLRGGRLSDPSFGSRMTGEGARAEAIARLFEMSCDKYGLNQEPTELTVAHFRRSESGQGELFG
jgi:DNA repair photolyase